MTETTLEKIEYLGRGVFDPPADIQTYLYDTITKLHPVNRDTLAAETGIPRTTIYDTIVKLKLKEKVRSYSVPQRRRGRPIVFYEPA